MTIVVVFVAVANCAVITSAVDWWESCEALLPLGEPSHTSIDHRSEPGTDG